MVGQTLTGKGATFLQRNQTLTDTIYFFEIVY